MNIKAQTTLFKTEFTLLLRNFIVIFFGIVFPAGMVLLFGSIYGNSPGSGFGGYGMVDLSFGAYAGIGICVTGLMSLPLTLAEYRQKRVLKRLQATPISPVSLLSSQVLVNLLFTIVAVILLYVVSAAVFGYQLRGSLGAFVLAFLIVCTCIFSIGLMIASLARNTRAANVICYLVYFPMLFLSGATMPLEMMPKGVKMFANILPLTHGIKLLKGVSLGFPMGDYITEILILLGICLVCTVLSVIFFKWE